MNSGRLRPIVYFIAALIFALFLFASTIVRLYTDWLWFGQVGYASVFNKIIGLQILVGVLAGLATLVVLFANVLIARRLAPAEPVMWQPSHIDPASNTLRMVQTGYSTRYFNIAALAVALVLSIGVGIAASSSWNTVLKYLNQVPFGVKDPVFGLDVSYHMFSIPFYRFVLGIGFAVVVFSVLLTAVVYAFNSGLAYRPGLGLDELKKVGPHIKAHLSVLMGLFFLLLAASYRLGTFDLLLSPTGVLFGAGYTDINARMPAIYLLSYASIVTAALFLINLHYRGWRLPVIGVAFIFAASIIIGGAYPAFVQQYSVSPNEIERETPYIKQAIKFTNLAYGLDQIKERPFAAEEGLNAGTIEANRQTIDNIRLWDWQQLLKTYNQIQSIRLYYDFMDIDVDRYEIDGRSQQVAITPRELRTASLPDNAKTWVNQHLVYTHGYGIVANKVNEVTEDGLPRLIVRDIPPRTDIDSLKVTRPEIYFGEQPDPEGDDYIVVGTKTREFDYPMGNTNKYTAYEGDDGVNIGNLPTKALFAWRFGTLRLLLADALTDQSRIIFHKNVIDRARMIAPFLEYENDPYIVVDRGRLFWILDAYTVHDRYPYSQPFSEESNYIKNSVKVVIDAYNGDADYYVFDDKDPLIKMYGKAFPGLFKDMDEMPKGLLGHVRYPEMLFNIQSRMFAAFHMNDAQVFYNKEDLWAISQESNGGERSAVEPYYIETKLPGEKDSSFMLLNTYTPTNKDNMIAWLGAKCDPQEYGQMLVYTFPKQKLVYGPTQVEARINQTPEISQQLSLWNQQGSRAIRGSIFVIPIEDSLLYVEPLYLQAEQTELPELKRVIVAYGSKIAMEPDLNSALNKIFGESAPRPANRPGEAQDGGDGGAVSTTPASVQELIDRASELFTSAQQKQRQGDWAGYGEDMEKLEDTLGELKSRSGQR